MERNTNCRIALTFFLFRVYLCFLFSDLNDLSSVINKRERPRIVIPPHNTSVLANSQAIFICISDGNPKPKTKWLFNNNEQLPDRYTLIKDSVLRLTTALSNDNGAKITCRSINVMGSDERNSFIKVYNDINVLPKGFPKYLGKSSIIVGQKHFNVTIECNVIGNPLPKIIWLKNFYPLDIRNSRFELQNERNLLLLKAAESDNAKYHCMAFNVHGVVISPPMSLMIRVSQFSPHFIYVTPDQYVRPGSSVILKCIGDGSPTPIVFWICGNTKLTASSVDSEASYPESVGTIKTILSDISESLNCTCVAKNHRESANHTVHIVIRNFPLAPLIVRLSSISHDSCLLTWKYQTTSHVPVSSFSVFYIETTLLRKEQPLSQNIDISVKEIRGSDFEINTKISDLRPFKNYSLWLVANGAEGVSEPSNIHTFITLESKPTSPPQNISILLLSESSVRIKWKSPLQRNGKIVSYDVFYAKNKETPISQWNIFTVSVIQDQEPLEHFLEIGFLDRNTVYYFKISSKTKVGYGPASSVITKYINDADMYRLNNLTVLYTSNDTIGLMWLINPFSMVQYFKLQYTPILDHTDQEGEGNYKIIRNRPNKQSIFFTTISSLSPNTRYHIAIFPAINGVLRTATKTKAKTTLINLREELSVIAKSANSITISLSQRLSDPDTGIDIEYFPYDNRFNAQTMKCRLSNEERVCTINKLKVHTLYHVTIKYNKIMSTTFVETWPSAPMKIRNLKLRIDCEPTRPCISARWTANNSLNTEFNIKYYPINFQQKDAVQRLTYSFNISKNTFISHPTTHVMGATVEFAVKGMTEFQMSEAVFSTITLPEGVPSDYPKNLHVRSNVLEKYVTLTWEIPRWDTINGQLILNEVICTSTNEKLKLLNQNITNNEIQISKLILRKEAQCQVRIWTRVGPGPWSPVIPIDDVYTDVEPPTDINAIRVSECCMKVTWKWRQEYLLSYSGFSIKSYVEDDNETLTITHTSFPSSLVYLDNLVPKKKYMLQVKSIMKDTKESPWSPITSTVPFLESWPTYSIHSPKCLVSHFREVTLQWMFSYNAKNLLHFRVNVTGITSYQAADGRTTSLIHEETENSLIFESNIQEYAMSFSNLHPNTQYSFDIEPIFCCAVPVWTVSTRTSCRTLEEAPENVPEPKITRIDVDNLVIHLLLEEPSNEYGFINIYYLVVAQNNLLSENVGSTDISAIDISSRTRDLIEATLLAKDNRSGLSNKQSQCIIFEINATFLMNRSILGKGFTFPLSYRDKESKFSHHKILARGVDYRAAFVACIASDFSKETVRRLCSVSSWSEIINPLHSRPFQLHRPENKSTKTNETDGENSILVGLVLTSVFVPLGLCSVIIFTRFYIKRRNNNFKLFHTCLKFRNSSQDYYPASGNEMKENLVNPLILTTNVGSSYSTHNPDSIEFKRYHISPTPDLLVQSSPSTSFKRMERPFPTSCNYSASQHKVPIALLHEYISNLKSNENRGFAREFESIDHANEYTWEHSNKVCNKAKNRYANVVAYDHSRVVLQSYPTGSEDLEYPDDPTTDYINANYINGYRKQNAYIATQGPLPETVSDFWRMVWEQRTSVIVMLTLLVERCRTKCEQYWPKGNKGAQCTFGGIVVTLNDVHELAYYVCRSFLIHKIGSTEKRDIKHFQFTAWPDHGVPQFTTPFLMFVTKIKKEASLDSGPIIVHCSAGVGRTGDFIAVDSMLEQVKHEKYLDIYSYVTHIRSQRNYMVQTEEQYIFIHNVLLDYLQSVNIEVTKQQLFSYVEKLSKIEIEKSGFIQVSGFQLEYRRLLSWSSCFSHIIPSTKSECSTKSSDSVTGQQEFFTVNYETALAIINQSKNRNPRCLPPDINRVVICPIRAVEGSDYINASWIDGYRSRKAYIATQCPLKETIEDFWRMLWEHDCGIVVTLNDMQLSSQFWPNLRSARYQFFVVDPVAEYQMSHLVLREFKLTDARDGQTRVMRLFQFVNWIDDTSLPISTENFLELIIQVHKTREQFGHKGPITVHCGSGSYRTGIFLALSILLDKLKDERSFNIFEIFKLLKWQRPSLVESEDQYQFCFAALLEYLTLYSEDSANC